VPIFSKRSLQKKVKSTPKLAKPGLPGKWLLKSMRCKWSLCWWTVVSVLIITVAHTDVAKSWLNHCFQDTFCGLMVYAKGRYEPSKTAKLNQLNCNIVASGLPGFPLFCSFTIWGLSRTFLQQLEGLGEHRRLL